MKLSVAEYRTLIASRARDIAELADGTAYQDAALSGVLPVAIARLNELSEALDTAVAEEKTTKAA